MQQRTDIPVMYDGEQVYQLDDGTLAAVVFRRVESPHTWLAAFACDCWAVDATGAPTGPSAARSYHTQPVAQMTDVDAALDAVRDLLLADLAAVTAAEAVLAASPRIRNLVAVSAPAVDVPHPLDVTPEQLAADLAALPDPYAPAPAAPG